VVQVQSRPIVLRRHASSVRRARRIAVSFAHDRGGDRVTQDLALVTSELVSNAIRHADQAITLAFRVVQDRVRVEVFDDGDGVPGLQAPHPSMETGRGLVIVAGVAEAWGTRAAAGRGKTVWAELPR
jgi:anti-sigma regulatory factor (Ser/Thr protein kinase)